MLGFVVALALAIGVIIGVIPVFHILRTNLAAVMQSSSRGSSSSRGVRALSGVLVVAQVGVALVLLTGAGLLIQSFAEALKVDTGLDASKVVTARVALTREHRASDEATADARRSRPQTAPVISGVRHQLREPREASLRLQHRAARLNTAQAASSQLDVRPRSQDGARVSHGGHAAESAPRTTICMLHSRLD